ncbi:serine hydrolase [Dyadobacter sp. LJ53]|uniref:serine hydrolase n=1 Tax=Dyadobacter chenwenxiniae TaxID=2906456 RepID=UPI001F1DD20A|nr:serine hydrolase [Dyadobacter chenwenxiniae]MCF0049331.1 serine hydrolase [Dyadobacter chenwenxiniae]
MDKFILLLGSLLMLVTQTRAQTATDDPRLAGIDTMVNRVLRDWHVVGCAVAVVEKNKVIYAKGFGYRDLDNRLPVTPNTVFSIASCTKAFTAQLIGTLVTNGKLNINQPVHHYYPELVFNNDLLTNYVTVKDMLTHRTGLPRHDWLTASKVPLSLDSIVYRIRFLEPSAGFREQLKYCNLMYTVLGGLVQKLTGETWEAYMKEKILTPLEMNNTNCLISDLTKASEYSWGYTVRNDTLIKGTLGSDGANAAGSMNASVNDMANWLIALLNEGTYKGKQVLSPRFVREATSPQMSAPSRPRFGLPAYPDAYFGDYGYGWNIASYRGHYQVTHGGDLPLFSSTTCFFPTDSVGIVVLVNKFDATISEIISDCIADKMLSLPYKDWNSLILARQPQNRAVSTSKRRPVGKPLTHPLLDYTGYYIHPAYGTIQVFNQNNTLQAIHNGRAIFFEHLNFDIFRAAVPGGRLQFSMNTEGKIISLSGALEPEVKDIIFLKKEK